MKRMNGRGSSATLLPAALLAMLLAFALGGCAAGGEGSQASSSGSVQVTACADTASADELRIVSMKGPTSVGLASMMQQEQGMFEVVSSADQVAPLLLQDEADVALVPANLACSLYHKTDGAIRVIDVNTLGVLFAVTADASVDSVQKLAGRTVYMTGKGTVPEYTLAALLAANGLSMDDVDVQFRSEPAEVAALIAADAEAVGILPQPYATALTMKNAGLSMTIDLAAEWEKTAGAGGGSMVTGVTVVKESVLAEKPGAVAAFLERHAASAAVAQDDPASIAQTVADLGIIDDAALAGAAIPRCNVVCLTGAPMREALSGYLAALYAQDPASVGGALPGDDFYHVPSE